MISSLCEARVTGVAFFDYFRMPLERRPSRSVSRVSHRGIANTVSGGYWPSQYTQFTNTKITNTSKQRDTNDPITRCLSHEQTLLLAIAAAAPAGSMQTVDCEDGLQDDDDNDDNHVDDDEKEEAKDEDDGDGGDGDGLAMQKTG
jgi:hypothetical protein